MAQRLAVLVNVRGSITGDPHEWIESVASMLSKSEDRTEIADGLEALHRRLEQGPVDAVVFFTKDMFEAALALHRRGVRSCVLTGMKSGLPEGEVVVIDKAREINRNNAATLIFGA